MIHQVHGDDPVAGQALPVITITLQPMPGHPGVFGPKVDIQDMPKGWQGAHEVLLLALGLVAEQMLKAPDLVQVAHPGMIGRVN